jgi:hypothetical protein
LASEWWQFMQKLDAENLKHAFLVWCTVHHKPMLLYVSVVLQ